MTANGHLTSDLLYLYILCSGLNIILFCCNVCVGCQMMRLLVSSGIKCAYVLINSLSFVMKEVLGLMNVTQQIFNK